MVVLVLAITTSSRTATAENPTNIKNKKLRHLKETEEENEKKQGESYTTVSITVNKKTKFTSRAYRDSIKVNALQRHLMALQWAANNNTSVSSTGGTTSGHRGAGSKGWLQSLEYVSRELTKVGYDVEYHNFSAPYWEEVTPPQLEVIESPIEVESNSLLLTTYGGSASGMIEAEVYPINDFDDEDEDDDGGCDEDDFVDFPAGGIALIRTGGCSRGTKIENAIDAKAGAILLVSKGDSNGDTPVSKGFRGINYPIPIVGGSAALGQSLWRAVAREEGDNVVVIRLKVDTIQEEERINQNILVETTHGDPSHTIVVGGHLDSVFEGPGIQDNGSGSAAILELAIQLKQQGFDNPHSSLQNKIRFAWWGAEELGLIGSDAYVDDLSQNDLDNIAMYVNLDMIGSPNFVRMVLDGDGSNPEDDAYYGKRRTFPPLHIRQRRTRQQPEDPRPSSSSRWKAMAHIERTLLQYFDDEVGLPVQEEPFVSSYERTDHTAFYDAGIPVTDLHTGSAGVPKTSEQVEFFGGKVGEDWDPCYHNNCDTINNVNLQVMQEMTHAVAHALATYGTAKPGELFRDPGEVTVDRRRWWWRWWEEFP